MISVLFFLSGISALLYQVVWQRLLSTVFGVSVYATSTVLAAFMAGLAVGSLLGGRLADRTRRPLLLFAAAEAGVGLCAALTPAALDVATSAYAALHARFGLGFAGLTAVRLGCSFALLLFPTTFMGATLPLILAASRRSSGGLGPRVARFYALNTLGAFAGALLAGYRLVGSMGLSGTVVVAVSLNLLIALSAALLAMRTSTSLDGALADHADRPRSGPVLSAGQGAALLAAFGASGFIALGLEVVWFRMLLAYLPTTTYAFTTMLATVLAGIGIGGLLATRSHGARPDELSRLGTLLAGIGVAGAVSANILARTYAAGWRTSGLIQACIVALLPATTLMGMAYPRGLALWAQAEARVGWRVGSFSAVNLSGGILGALLGGFVILPALGTRGGLVALCGASALSGLALAAFGRSLRGLAPPAALILFGTLAVVTLPDPWDAALGRRHPGHVALWREESAQATVAVHRQPDGGRVLYIDGVHQASDDAVITSVHRRIGLVPLLLHPDPRRALVIGLAGGATPGTIALHPDVQVDIVELSDAVVGASDFFTHLNGGLLRRPNVRVAVGDGRNHLLLTDRRYDIITADLVQPFHAGAGNLYSVEYFRLCRRALTPSGMMVQWIGHPPEAQYRMILRTFLAAFPETTFWGHQFLVGSRTPARLQRAAFERARRHPELAALFREAGLDSIEALRGWYTAGPGELRRFAGDGDILTDDRPLAEYYLSIRGPSRAVDLSGLTGSPDALLEP